MKLIFDAVKTLLAQGCTPQVYQVKDGRHQIGVCLGEKNGTPARNEEVWNRQMSVMVQALERAEKACGRKGKSFERSEKKDFGDIKVHHEIDGDAVRVRLTKKFSKPLQSKGLPSHIFISTTQKPPRRLLAIIKRRSDENRLLQRKANKMREARYGVLTKIWG